MQLQESGMYELKETTASGCKQCTQLNLEVVPNQLNNLTETLCYGSSYNIDSKVYTQTGNYQKVLKTDTGCDSIIQLELIILPQKIQSIDTILCKGQQISIGNDVFTQDGFYQTILPESDGCDSLVELSLIVEEAVD